MSRGHVKVQSGQIGGLPDSVRQQALRAAAGLIDAMSLDRLYGEDVQYANDTLIGQMTEAQNRVVILLRAAANSLSSDSEVSAWDRMNHEQLLEDAKRQHADKLDAERRCENLQRSIRRLKDEVRRLRWKCEGKS